MFGLKKRRLNKNGEERKVRSDKKREVQPIISTTLKTNVERLAFILDRPVKTIGEQLCHEGIHTNDVTEYLAPFFQRGILRIGNTLHYGSEENPSLKERPDDSPVDRISLRFTERNFEDIRTLANLLDASYSRTVAILLDASIRHHGIVDTIIEQYNRHSTLDDERKTELKRFLRYVNKSNPYAEKSWNEKLMDVIDEGVQGVKEIRAAKLTAKMIDTETYVWNFEEESNVSPTKDKKNKKK